MEGLKEKRNQFYVLKRNYYLPNECQNCGSTEELHVHHIVPLILGGTNKSSNLCVLCEGCHGKVHGMHFSNKALKEGRERAKKQGKHMGRPSQDKEKIHMALNLYDERESNGLSVIKIAEITGVPRSTIYAELKKVVL